MQKLQQDVSRNQKVEATELSYTEDEDEEASSNNKNWKTSANDILNKFTHSPIYTSVITNSIFSETRALKRGNTLRNLMPHRMNLQKGTRINTFLCEVYTNTHISLTDFHHFIPFSQRDSTKKQHHKFQMEQIPQERFFSCC